MPYGAGGIADVTMRMVAEKLSDKLGQSFIIDNRPGAAGVIGIQAVVLNGSKIGRNCVVGAGSVVTEGKEFPDNSLIIGAPAIVVKLPDGRDFSNVEVLAIDEHHDLAVIRIKARNLPALSLGDSDRVKAGGRVVAIGHPLGLGDTVSDGLVSAIRQLDKDFTVMQISAPIAHGSSGGPLLEAVNNLYGARAPRVCTDMKDYFRDIADHLQRLNQTIESRVAQERIQNAFLCNVDS